MSVRRWLLPAAAVLLAGSCAVRPPRATDPVPTLPALTDAEPLPVEAPAPAAAPAPAVPAAPAAAEAKAPPPPPPPAVEPAPAPPAEAPEAPEPKKRFWGRVAITTAVVSPSQLMGPEIAMSPGFLRLPVFPENLVFDVSWGFVSVGQATLGVDKLVMFNGRPAYHIVSTARSNSFCDTFYPVRDLNESWLDARTLTSLGYSKKLREGHYWRDVWVLYDRDAGTFVERQTRKNGHFEVKTGTIPARVQDILSSVYFVRAHDLPVGGSVVVDVNTPDNWPLIVKVEKKETVTVPAGTIPTVLVEPAMRKEGLFIQKGKRLRLWLSDDAARRPVLMKVQVFFGHITAALHEMI